MISANALHFPRLPLRIIYLFIYLFIYLHPSLVENFTEYKTTATKLQRSPLHSYGIKSEVIFT